MCRVFKAIRALLAQQARAFRVQPVLRAFRVTRALQVPVLRALLAHKGQPVRKEYKAIQV